MIGEKPKILHSQVWTSLPWQSLPQMWIAPSKWLELKSSFLSEAIALNDDKMLLLKLLSFKSSTSSLLNMENLSKPAILIVLQSCCSMFTTLYSCKMKNYTLHWIYVVSLLQYVNLTDVWAHYIYSMHSIFFSQIVYNEAYIQLISCINILYKDKGREWKEKVIARKKQIL